MASISSQPPRVRSYKVKSRIHSISFFHSNPCQSYQANVKTKIWTVSVVPCSPVCHEKIIVILWVESLKRVVQISLIYGSILWRRYHAYHLQLKLSLCVSRKHLHIPANYDIHVTITWYHFILYLCGCWSAQYLYTWIHEYRWNCCMYLNDDSFVVVSSLPLIQMCTIKCVLNVYPWLYHVLFYQEFTYSYDIC